MHTSISIRHCLAVIEPWGPSSVENLGSYLVCFSLRPALYLSNEKSIVAVWYVSRVWYNKLLKQCTSYVIIITIWMHNIKHHLH